MPPTHTASAAFRDRVATSLRAIGDCDNRRDTCGCKPSIDSDQTENVVDATERVRNRAVRNPSRAGNSLGEFGSRRGGVNDLEGPFVTQLDRLQCVGLAHCTLGACSDLLARQRRRQRIGCRPSVRLLDLDGLGCRRGRIHQATDDVVTRHQPDGNALRGGIEGVDVGLGDGLTVEADVGEQARERVRQNAGAAGRCVVADKQCDVVIGRQPLRHALHLRCSEDQTRPRIQVCVKQVVHRSVAVVDQDARRTGVERTRDRSVGLGGHEHLRTVVAATATDRLIERRDTRDTLHVHRNIDVHFLSSIDLNRPN